MESEIVRVVSLCTTEISEMTWLKVRSSGCLYLNASANDIDQGKTAQYVHADLCQILLLLIKFSAYSWSTLYQTTNFDFFKLKAFADDKINVT